MKKIRNVLSLFDGMSGGRLALDLANIKFDKYYASEIDKFSQIVSDKNYPDIIRLGDITKWKEWKLDWSKIDLILAGSPCFVSGTKILTRRGYKNIELIKVDDIVLTHKGNWKKVLRVGGKLDNTYKLIANGIIDTTTTLNHPYLVKNRYQKWNEFNKKFENKISKTLWKKVGDIKEGDYIAIPRIKNVDNLNLSFDDCLIIGQYISKKIDKEKLNKNILKVVIKYIDELERKIPIEFLQLPKDKLKFLISGMVNIDKNLNCYLQTKNEEVAQSLCLAVAKVYGICAEIKIVKSTYQVSFKKNYKKNDIDCFADDNYVWTRFIKVIKTNNVEPVFNIEVKDDNSYTANSVIVHNCQGFSYVGKQLAFDDPRSVLFFKFVEILKHVKKFNKEVKFLLENVKMKKTSENIITDYMGLNPILINSKLVSAQDRKRLYWFNWKVNQPEDKNLLLKDILEINNEKNLKYIMSDSWHKWWVKNREYQENKKFSQVCNDKDKAITMLARQYASWNGNFVEVSKNIFRKLTPTECEKLQSFPINYSEGVPDNQRYKMLGNGWTVEVISHILKGLN